MKGSKCVVSKPATGKEYPASVSQVQNENCQDRVQNGGRNAAQEGSK